ncbi:MAG TPA: chemotaxis protein CheW [Mariprofundaceae bacterium]|nr:chemotaxis protein CheW [Mariprofundaceae bacterium]
MNDAQELLTCSLHGQSLGLPVRNVQEVVTPLRCTPIPLAHDVVSGLINLRGHVITQLDMRKALGLPDREESDPFRVVIIETDDGEDFGLIVDQVGEVMRPETSTLEKTPKSLPPCWQDVGSGVLKLEERLLVVLDIERFIRRTLEMSDSNQLSSAMTGIQEAVE